MTGSVIHIVEPAGRPDHGLLARNIQDLEQRGFVVRYTPMCPEPRWPYASGTAQARCDALSAALVDDDCDYVVAARGGYGASDLLPLMNWEVLRRARPRCLVGLSDITALQVAIHDRLGWCGLHAVMPGGTLWQPGSSYTEHVIDLLLQGPPWCEKLALEPVGTERSEVVIEGKLLGGCLAVLTGMIGTPYSASSWKDNILFVEDVNENPGRLMRFWNQWDQSGALTGLRAVVIGQLAGISERRDVLRQFALRTPCPVYSCEQFGHEVPSYALGQGARARIEDSALCWEIDRI